MLLEVARIRAELGAGRSAAQDGFSPVRIGRIGRSATARETFAPEAILKLPF